jgi:hypothetical protein
MAQEYDISEFWENFDDKSVFIQKEISDENKTEEESDTNFLENIDEFIYLHENDEYNVSSDEDKQKNKKQKIDNQEKIVKKMYGCKNKHYSLLTEEDIFIKNKIEEIFNHMRNQNC